MWSMCSMRSMKFGTAPVSGWERRSSAPAGAFMELSVTRSENPRAGGTKRKDAAGHQTRLATMVANHAAGLLAGQPRRDNGLTGCTGDSRLSYAVGRQ